MKANRKFKEDGEAVSAVIGVILMVAITVAIAATVYVYVSGMLGTGQESTPNIQFAKSSEGLTVSRADSDLTWSEFEVTNESGDVTMNGDVDAGDVISAGDTTTWIKVVHTDTNSLLGNWSFA
jgi:FlaG/FlaF family flagellin (archaellin)